MFTLIGAIIFCSGMLLGIRCYRHAQMPFMDLTPVQSPIDENTVGEKHPDHIESDHGLDWNIAERYINDLGDTEDSDE